MGNEIAYSNFIGDSVGMGRSDSMMQGTINC